MKKRGLAFITPVVLAIFLAGCSESYDGAKTAESYDYNGGSDLYYGEDYDLSDGTVSENSGSVENNRKLIKTMDLTAETYEFDELTSTLEKKVKTLGGYMESSSVHTDWNDLKYGDFMVRIPEDKLDDFVSEFAKVSNITDKSSTQKDVTLSYVDLESHKAALEAEEESLLNLLENAVSIEDIITIQDRLTDVRYQLESMESQLRTLDNQINYATINLHIEEVETYTPIEKPSFGERISTGFWESMEDIGDGFVNLTVFLLVNSPYLFILALVVTVTVIVLRLIIKAAIKKGDENEAKRLKQQQAQMQQIQMQQMNAQNVNIQNGQKNGK